jgi:signal transduction histidine kinase/pSer/pThr/pTyr-binding forkhead associated (FHA) protein
VKLIIIAGPNKGTVFDVQENRCTLGRAHSNRVVLYDQRVSAYHAVIEPDGGRHAVRDLGSANGTYVDSLLVTRALLRPGSTIQLGETVLAFERPPLPEDDGANFSVVDASPGETTAIYATVGKDETTILEEDSVGDIEALREDRRNLLALYRVTSVINSVSEIRPLLTRVLEEVLDALDAERGFALLREPESEELVPAAMRRRHAGGSTSPLTMSKSIARQVMDKREAVLSTTEVAGKRVSAMCAPLHGRTELQGLIYVDTPTSSQAFSPRDLQLLTAMADQLGTALENLRLMEARLAGERFAAIGQAVAGLSHYIKNILSCMEGGAQIVQRGIDHNDPEVAHRGWAIVRRNERKISDLVLDMLNYSGANEPLREPCSLNDLVEDVAEPLAGEADKEVRVECELDPDLPVAQLDSRAIHRCLLNLVSNAIDALPDEGGEVRLATAYDAEERMLHVSVQDSGCGIEPEILPTIFGAFASTKGSRGTGLGLAVVKKLVEEHGGRVEVQSEPGQGSTFTLVLPIEPPPRGQPATGGAETEGVPRPEIQSRDA